MEDREVCNDSSKKKWGGGLGLRTRVSVVDDWRNGLLRSKVEEGEAAQAVVGLDQAGHYVNRRLSLLGAERTGDVSPVGRGVGCGKDTSWCSLRSIWAKMSHFCSYVPHPV